MRGWKTSAVLGSLLALRNAQGMTSVPLVDELRMRLATDYAGVGNLFGYALQSSGGFAQPGAGTGHALGAHSFSPLGW